MSKTKLQEIKITASLAVGCCACPQCSNFDLSGSQAAAHWLQRKVRQGLVFWYSKMRLVACGLALQPTNGAMLSF
jgi:cytochrome c-type biogenesis protein CcmH/NrfF